MKQEATFPHITESKIIFLITNCFPSNMGLLSIEGGAFSDPDYIALLENL